MEYFKRLQKVKKVFEDGSPRYDEALYRYLVALLTLLEISLYLAFVFDRVECVLDRVAAVRAPVRNSSHFSVDYINRNCEYERKQHDNAYFYIMVFMTLFSLFVAYKSSQFNSALDRFYNRIAAWKDPEDKMEILCSQVDSTVNKYLKIKLAIFVLFGCVIVVLSIQAWSAVFADTVFQKMKLNAFMCGGKVSYPWQLDVASMTTPDALEWEWLSVPGELAAVYNKIVPQYRCVFADASLLTLSDSFMLLARLFVWMVGAYSAYDLYDFHNNWLASVRARLRGETRDNDEGDEEGGPRRRKRSQSLRMKAREIVHVLSPNPEYNQTGEDPFFEANSSLPPAGSKASQSFPSLPPSALHAWLTSAGASDAAAVASSFRAGVNGVLDALRSPPDAVLRKTASLDPIEHEALVGLLEKAFGSHPEERYTPTMEYAYERGLEAYFASMATGTAPNGERSTPSTRRSPPLRMPKAPAAALPSELALEVGDTSSFSDFSDFPDFERGVVGAGGQREGVALWASASSSPRGSWRGNGS